MKLKATIKKQKIIRNYFAIQTNKTFKWQFRSLKKKTNISFILISTGWFITEDKDKNSTPYWNIQHGYQISLKKYFIIRIQLLYE